MISSGLEIRKGWVCILLATSLAAAAGCQSGAKAPLSYARCEKCHGFPGGGDMKGGPDLAKSGLSKEDFITQVKQGSRWKEKDAIQSAYRWKKMPPQTGVSDKEIEEIYKYVKSSK